MQKKLIALAVASLASGAAFAQTNVTIYGIADAGYVYSSGDPIKGVAGTNTFSGIVSGILSGSRLGFRGEEALGNGLKAIFTLEYALNIDTNAGLGYSGSSTGLNSRQQFVGLSSATLGTVALGRQYSPGYQATANNDPMGGALVESQSFLSNNAGYTITPNSPARWDNALTYTTPNWSGFSAKAIYSFGETQDAFGTYNDKNVSVTDNSKWALGANYANGPLNIDVVYQARDNIRPTGTPAINSFDTQEWYVGGSYDLKMVKLMGSWQGMNVSNSTRLINNSQVDSQLWQIGAVIPVLSASNIHLGYAQLMMDGNNKAVIPLTGDSQSATLAWTTALSKRTTFYAGYVWAQNDKKSIAAAPVGGGILTGAIGARGEDSNTLTAGLRHSF
ncbi:porin [Accumulibacter sp.]|uniref:porin n=1 Tax=Accumulibacter sp. TaxID=2053492 RepID=UPI002BB32E1D|nr:porin [Accumulibacter sp.]HPU80979.1 porin [Accumulibacter sp.]